MKLVMFDVDGTLTETVEADEECFVQALLGVFGFTDLDTDCAWECSARFKLANGDLHFPCIPAAFSDCAHSREAIMQASATRAAEFYSRPAFDDVVYVGDGLWDARASHNLGFSFVGISRDPAKVERLYAEGAVRVFLNYLDKDAVLNVLTSA
jgi:phosphoglycolate phosphatase-like HAD superfamily hydrolase